MAHCGMNRSRSPKGVDGNVTDDSRKVGLQYAASVRFDADAIIHRVSEPLFAAEIPLSRLDAHVAEQEPDLFLRPSPGTETCLFRCPR